MGIPIFPPVYIPGSGCVTCFDPDLTPQFVYCTIGDCNRIGWLPPGFPENLNGMFRLEWDGNCIWSTTVGILTISWQAAPTRSQLTIVFWPMLFTQSGRNPNLCYTDFKLNIYSGPNYYTAGQGSITF